MIHPNKQGCNSKKKSLISVGLDAGMLLCQQNVDRPSYTKLHKEKQRMGIKNGYQGSQIQVQNCLFREQGKMETCAEHEWETEEENGALQIRLLQECVNWGVLEVCADI